MSKHILKQMIINVIDNHPRGYVNVLAEIAGYNGASKGSNFKKVLNDSKRDFDNFSGLVELVTFLFEENKQEIMEEYSKEIDPCNRVARNMLEYLSCNRSLDAMKELIDRMLVCKNKESVEYAKVYSLQYEWQLNYHTLNINNHIKNIKETHSNIKELDVFIRLQMCYSYYFKDNHNRAYEISLELLDDVDDISNDYIKNMYKAKLSEILSYIKLWVMNDPEESRTYANNVIDAKIGKTYDAYALYTIGLSYFYTSYDNALSYLTKSENLYNLINRELAAKDVQEYIEKLNVFWDKDLTNHDFIALDNKLLFKFKKCEDISTDIETSKENLDEAMYYFLKGLSNQDREALMESLIILIDRGDTFWANLVKIELLKIGESERVINRLMNINNA